MGSINEPLRIPSSIDSASTSPGGAQVNLNRVSHSIGGKRLHARRSSRQIRPRGVNTTNESRSDRVRSSRKAKRSVSSSRKAGADRTVIGGGDQSDSRRSMEQGSNRKNAPSQSTSGSSITSGRLAVGVGAGFGEGTCMICYAGGYCNPDLIKN